MITIDDHECIAEALREMAKDFRQYDPSVGIFSNDAVADYIDGLASDVEGQELERIRSESIERKNRLAELEQQLKTCRNDTLTRAAEIADNLHIYDDYNSLEYKCDNQDAAEAIRKEIEK